MVNGSDGSPLSNKINKELRSSSQSFCRVALLLIPDDWWLMVLIETLSHWGLGWERSQNETLLELPLEHGDMNNTPADFSYLLLVEPVILLVMTGTLRNFSSTLVVITLTLTILLITSSSKQLSLQLTFRLSAFRNWNEKKMNLEKHKLIKDFLRLQ